MHKLPKKQIHLLVIAGLTIFITILFYYIVIEPKTVVINNYKEEFSATKVKLLKTKWPLDQNRLHFLLTSKRKEINGVNGNNGLENKVKKTMTLATEVFNDKIKQFFTNPSDFITDISLLDYQEEYNKLEQKLNSNYIFISEEITHLSENTTNKEMYKPLLQVWTISMLTDALTKAHLRLLKDRKTIVRLENGRSQYASEIQVQPIKKYFLYDADAKPYLLEFPIRFRCTGSIRQLTKFLKIIQTKPYFFPVSHLQIKSLPRSQYQGSNYVIKTKTLIFEIECCSFFRPNLKKIPQQHKKKAIKALPAGA